ncbi:hypothetical protein H8L32_15100 [Undibacterium sp. CY18W]|uniref:Intracellular septation protein A n=1 Tax=Undibacterium hunanense TaxID=2762292 RepID=A0ABR6ZSM4_9BURK|nr:hypothetical protein [Undibacterium hunanense]MBC3918819.1 hypothetical protein [Undibacterium hunanense]
MPLLLKKMLMCTLLLCAGLVQANEAVKPGGPIEIDLSGDIDIPAAGVCASLATDQFDLVELRINGILSQRKLKDCNPDPVMNKLVFHLPQADTGNSALERESLMGSPWQEMRHNYHRDLPFNVSFKNGGSTAILTSGVLRFQVLKPICVLFGFGFIAIVGYALFRLGRDSGLLRDSSSAAVGERTFSLARVQMAWWFFIVLVSYIWLWIVAEGIPTISPQALGLLGIGSATYLTAAGVDVSKQNQFGESKGFFKDVLSDSQGLTLHRFQMLVFNVLIGVLFLVYVIQHFDMPLFDGNILTLLGMSAGTYAGFKIPEQQGKAAPDGAKVASDDPKAGYTAET